jgi:ankyrin repeat protein
VDLDPARADDYGQDETPLNLTETRRVKSDEKANIVQLLIQHMADVTARDDTGSTPLHMASFKGSGKTVKLLLGHGADINAQDGKRSTPLHQAASSRLALKGDVVHLLLSHGANLFAMDDEGMIPFQIGSSRGISKITELHQGRGE